MACKGGAKTPDAQSRIYGHVGPDSFDKYSPTSQSAAGALQTSIKNVVAGQQPCWESWYVDLTIVSGPNTSFVNSKGKRIYIPEHTNPHKMGDGNEYLNRTC